MASAGTNMHTYAQIYLQNSDTSCLTDGQTLKMAELGHRKPRELHRQKRRGGINIKEIFQWISCLPCPDSLQGLSGHSGAPSHQCLSIQLPMGLTVKWCH